MAGNDGPATPYRWTGDRQLIVCGTAVALLLIALLGDNSDGFYTFLRIYVCGLAAVLAFRFWREDVNVWFVAMVLTAILFNPITPVEMERDEWVPFDIAAAVAFSWLAMRGPARAYDKPYLRAGPVAVGVAVAGILALASTDLADWSADSSDMAVDNLTVDNLIAENLVMETDLAREPDPWNLLSETPPTGGGATATESIQPPPFSAGVLNSSADIEATAPPAAGTARDNADSLRAVREYLAPPIQNDTPDPDSENLTTNEL